MYRRSDNGVGDLEIHEGVHFFQKTVDGSGVFEFDHLVNLPHESLAPRAERIRGTC